MSRPKDRNASFWASISTRLMRDLNPPTNIDITVDIPGDRLIVASPTHGFMISRQIIIEQPYLVLLMNARNALGELISGRIVSSSDRLRERLKAYAPGYRGSGVL